MGSTGSGEKRKWREKKKKKKKGLKFFTVAREKTGKSF